jgi:cell division septum initiation protein DivIVA
VKELQAYLVRNDKLEKENHELRQEVARLKAPESVKSNTKGQEVRNPNPKPTIQGQSTATKPPPPPPLPSKRTLGKRSVRRAPEVVEFYRALTKRESHMGNKINQNGVLSPAFNRNMIGEIENRSKYLSDVSTIQDKLCPS